MMRAATILQRTRVEGVEFHPFSGESILTFVKLLFCPCDLYAIPLDQSCRKNISIQKNATAAAIFDRDQGQ
jgi:hypothetical protein